MYSTGHAGTLPEPLVQVLQDPTIVKVGCNVGGDGSRLVRDFANVPSVAGLHDYSKTWTLEKHVNAYCPAHLHIDKQVTNPPQSSALKPSALSPALSSLTFHRAWRPKSDCRTGPCGH